MADANIVDAIFRRFSVNGLFANPRHENMFWDVFDCFPMKPAKAKMLTGANPRVKNAIVVDYLMTVGRKVGVHCSLLRCVSDSRKQNDQIMKTIGRLPGRSLKSMAVIRVTKDTMKVYTLALLKAIARELRERSDKQKQERDEEAKTWI